MRKQGAGTATAFDHAGARITQRKVATALAAGEINQLCLVEQVADESGLVGTCANHQFTGDQRVR